MVFGWCRCIKQGGGRRCKRLALCRRLIADLFSIPHHYQTFGAHYPAVKIPGYNVWPLKLVTKLYRLAKSRTGPGFDLTLHTYTPVTAIESAKVLSSVSGSSTNATRAYTLSTPRGTIACSRVVHATNGYASHLLPFLAGPQGIVPVRGQVIATRASVGTDEIKTNGWTGNEV